MAVATTTALLIGAGIKAGVDAFSAHKASKTAEKAAEQQTNAIREARGVSQDLYAPWLNTGGQAATTMGALMGFAPPPGPPQQQIGDNRFPGGTYDLVPGAPSGHGPGREWQMRQKALNEGIENYDGIGKGAVQKLEARMGEVAPQLLRSSFVRMRSADGEEDDVPEELASSFEKEGFQRVHG